MSKLDGLMTLEQYEAAPYETRLELVFARARQEAPKLRIVKTAKGLLFFDEHGREMVVLDD